MIWLGGFLSLDLATGTPDAFCPPLEEARAAVRSRVGEVKGDYHAEFTLVRDDEGQQRLDLTLREGTTEVLRRELPLDAAGCQDAAQTIALILERYFDAIERPAAPEPTRERDAAPKAMEPALAPPHPARAREDAVVPAAAPPSPLGAHARAGALFDRELGLAAVIGASIHPASLRVTPNMGVGLGLELAPFFARQSETFRDKQVEAFLIQSAFCVPVTWFQSRWQASVGPWFQLRWQRADSASITQERTATRVVPGLGGFVRVGVDLTASVGLAAGVAAGPQLRGAASQFVLQGAAGQMTVLVPDPWFGHGQLTLELKL